MTVDPDMDSGGVILNLPIPVYQSSSSVAAGQAPVAAEGGAGTVVINNKVVQLNPAVPGYEAVSKSFLTHTPGEKREGHTHTLKHTMAEVFKTSSCISSFFQIFSPCVCVFTIFTEIPDSPESISSLVPSRNDLDDDELKF